jgi:hypothetical protein
LKWSGTFLFEGPLKHRYIPVFICVLLFTAAVDTIPDPDAIMSLSIHASTICITHIREHSNTNNNQLTLLVNLLQFHRMNWFFWMSAFDARPFGRANPHQVHLAADSSPPSYI